MKMKWYKTWDYKTKRNYWWTQRYTNKGICFEIRVNEFNSDVLNLYMCDKLISKHTDLIDAEKSGRESAFRDLVETGASPSAGDSRPALMMTG